ncbi:hypothetical protein XENORESO_021908 [Xenotaenia resolanae]|uniref:Ig-like domain-containing protein n=1 Tax=Xenotaenia resolanae TaxID=208358 RepID=A0ABV0X688_9TELE
MCSAVFSVYKLQVVRSAEGKECVVLPCKTKTRLPHSATIEWRRVDTDEVVHLYPSSQQQQPEMARGATEMNVNPLRTGDLRLTLFNPSHYDSGLYVCTVQKDGHNLKQKVVSLFVQGELIICRSRTHEDEIIQDETVTDILLLIFLMFSLHLDNMKPPSVCLLLGVSAVLLTGGTVSKGRIIYIHVNTYEGDESTEVASSRYYCQW